MKIKFVNRGLLNLLEPLSLSEDMIKEVIICESMFIITTKSGAIITKDYKIEKD